MSRYSRDHVPAYTLHKHTGQAVVRIGKKDYYLGVFDSPESREKYNRLIGDWFAGGRDAAALADVNAPPAASGPTVEDVLAAFWVHALMYYRDREGKPSREQRNFLDVMKLLRRMYGTTPAASFGPLSLEKCQAEMVRHGLARKHINRRVGRIRQVFKWAVAREMIPPSVFEGLRAVAGLKRGRSSAKELPSVKPVSEDHVKAVIVRANRFIGAMLELQMLTGMRSGEMVIMRTADINRSGSVWTYRPTKHKTEHHGHDRIVYLGVKARAVIAPFLRMDPTAYIFSPADAEAERLEARAAARRTPLSCGNRPGTNRKARRSRPLGLCYTTESYCRAVASLCDKTFPPPAGLTDEALKAWRAEHRFHPHQLRHTAATRFRRESGIETARVLLGQKSVQAAEIYAEQDMERARDFAGRAG